MDIHVLDFLDQSGIQYRDVSLPTSHPVFTESRDEVAYSVIRDAIAQADVVLINVGKYDEYKRWIDMELQISTTEFEKKKPIIVQHAWGPERTDESVLAHADAVLNGWERVPYADTITKLG